MKIKRSEILSEMFEESKMSRMGFENILWSVYKVAVETQLFNEREGKMFDMIIKGATLNEVGKHFDLTRERVRQIYNRSLRKAQVMLCRINEQRKHIAKYQEQIECLTAENKILRETNRRLTDELSNYVDKDKKDDVEIDTTPLHEFDFTTRALNCFNAAGIKTVGELRMFSPRDLCKFRNFGRKSIEEVQDFFKKYYNEKW